MGLFKPNPQRLMGTARALHLRADELDRKGKHGKAYVERRKAQRVEARAASRS